MCEKLTPNARSTNIVIVHSIYFERRVAMTIDELAREYEEQHKILQNKIKGLRPLLCIYSGEDLLLLRKRISVYYDMACECKRISALLSRYYDDEEAAV